MNSKFIALTSVMLIILFLFSTVGNVFAYQRTDYISRSIWMPWETYTWYLGATIDTVTYTAEIWVAYPGWYNIMMLYQVEFWWGAMVISDNHGGGPWATYWLRPQGQQMGPNLFGYTVFTVDYTEPTVVNVYVQFNYIGIDVTGGAVHEYQELTWSFNIF